MRNKKRHLISARRGTLAACLMAFAFLLTQPDQARAQCSCPWVANGNNINNTNTGNVGIGTTNPAFNLHVVGPIFSSGPQAIQAFQDRTSGRFWGWYSSGDVARLWNGTNDMITVTSGGKVGIGTLNPAYNLHVVGAVFSSGPQAMHAFQDRTSERPWAWYGSGDLVRLWNGTIDIIAITPSGDVGIGTMAPSSKLHVAGDVTLTGTGNLSASGTITAGNIVAKYQDIAEWVPSRQTMPAGTVVVLDANQLHYVQASSQAYDTRVAGVVSDSPGVILGEAGEGKVKVATTGRVRVKVDATRRPIRVGDLLVTSDKAGIAMRSEPLDLGGTPIHRPGTILGKALEPLDKGVGEILVLLSLQ
jgi:hypothetical protein